MKTIKIIIISLLVGLNLTSCDFLEKDPTYTTPENFFKNEADATSWLTGTYAILGQSSFYGNEFLYLVGGDLSTTTYYLLLNTYYLLIKCANQQKRK